jgi:hypothetical protein
MKPKKTTVREHKPARRRKTETPPDEAGTASSRPEREDGDAEAVPPFAGTAEAEQERAEEREQGRAADDGMPGEDVLRPDSGR